MAGDWIKMRASLQRDPRVIKIASALNADRLRVIGGLHAVWSLADEQTEDGFLDGYTFAVIDQMIGCEGFCEALKVVNWAEQEKGGVSFPRFEKHNGQSAKRRAQESDRKRSARASAPDADKKRTREEKRREEITTPLPPSGAFLRFWSSWPKNIRKQSQGKCWSIWRQKDFDQIAPAILSHVEALKASSDWLKDSGAFIPAPLVYLNQRRWEGAEAEAPAERRVAMP